jgi:fumarate hydratase subunit beta
VDRTELRTPLNEEEVRRLRVGDIVYVTGTVVTARDAAHKRIIQHLRQEKELPVRLSGLALYHCGPLVRKVDREWKVLAAGPTTSMRMEPFEDEVIKNLGVRLVIGKGGMGEKTLKAMKELGAAYGVFTGGAGVLAARRIKRVKHVEWLDLGIPDAVWVFEVDAFGPLIIGIDAHGNSVFDRVLHEAEERKLGIIGEF